MGDKGSRLIHGVMAGAREGYKIFICFSFRVLEGDGKEDPLQLALQGAAREAVERGCFLTNIWLSHVPGFSPVTTHLHRASSWEHSERPRGDLQAPPAFPALQKDVEILISSFACCRAR